MAHRCAAHSDVTADEGAHAAVTLDDGVRRPSFNTHHGRRQRSAAAPAHHNADPHPRNGTQLAALTAGTTSRMARCAHLFHPTGTSASATRAEEGLGAASCSSTLAAGSYDIHARPTGRAPACGRSQLNTTVTGICSQDEAAGRLRRAAREALGGVAGRSFGYNTVHWHAFGCSTSAWVGARGMTGGAGAWPLADGLRWAP